jgi:hypothetical protein
VIYQTKKVSYFLSKKDKIQDLSRSNFVYKFSCPGCNRAKKKRTKRNLVKQLLEHLDLLKSAISKHLTKCEHANFILALNNLYDNLNDCDSHHRWWKGRIGKGGLGREYVIVMKIWQSRDLKPTRSVDRCLK